MASDNKANQCSMKGKQWSEYVLKLPPEARDRYVTKLRYREGTCSLPDPYCLRNGWLEDPTMWPHVTFTDIYFYLVDTPGQFTHDSMRAFKSLKAYEYVESGHVFPIQYHKVDDESSYCLLKTKVIPSQRLRDKPHQPWVYVSKASGTVYCAHCTCMAVLGEVCSHVAALLFKVDAAVRAGLTSKSCTSDACTWNATYRKELQPLPVQEVQILFSCRRKKEAETFSASGCAPLPDHNILQSLKDILPDAVFFKSIPPLDEEETDSADEDGEKHSFPPTLTSLAYSDFKDDDDLTAVCDRRWKQYHCEPVQVKNLEQATRNQSISSLWYEHRKGRITGTKAHDILVMKKSTDPNTVKKVMGYNSKNISKVKAVAWGIDNENKARKHYSGHESQRHVNYKCSLVGLMVSQTKPFLGASSDGTIQCDCCGVGCLEIKFPYKHRDSDLQSAAKDKDFCLNDKLELKRGHKYFTPVQLQMYVHEVPYCDFVVFTNIDMAIVRVPYDNDFCSTLISKCESFFFDYILPEIVSRKIENTEPALQCQNQSEDIDVWCLCQQEEHGLMIMCEGANCSYTWFHYACVNVRRKPKGAWFCPSCVMG